MNLSNPTIYNKTLPLANTEYSQKLSPFIRYFQIQCRNLSDIKLSFTETESGTKYITVPSGASFSIRGYMAGERTLYFQSADAGVVVEILEWS
jgi:hypothetical protein